VESSEPTSATPLSVDVLLEQAVHLGASDLHLTTGVSPMVRRRGHIEALDGFPTLDTDLMRQLVYRITTTEQQKNLELGRQLDFAYGIRGLARFRVNAYYQRESLAGAFRTIPTDIRSLEELGLPASLHELTSKPRGLVLVTGPTGSGKSTTLASIIDEINRTPQRPHHHDRGSDRVPSRSQALHRQPARDRPGRDRVRDALRGALRQDPDVILLGEMRDLETISTALTAAETGTSSSGRCTPRARRARSTASSTCSRPSSRRRCGCSSRTRSRASSPRRCSRRRTAADALPPSRFSSSTTRSGT
jgi:twitching motility protein PilT